MWLGLVSSIAREPSSPGTVFGKRKGSLKLSALGSGSWHNRAHDDELSLTQDNKQKLNTERDNDLCLPKKLMKAPREGELPTF